ETRNFIKTRGEYVGFDAGKRFCVPLAARKTAPWLCPRDTRQSLSFETVVSNEALLEVSNVSVLAYEAGADPGADDRVGHGGRRHISDQQRQHLLSGQLL